jgi:AraC-like DNA-binding protein/quercetin dioxygenase-like cupin family protein
MVKKARTGEVRVFRPINVEHVRIVRGVGVTNHFPRHTHSMFCAGIVHHGRRVISQRGTSTAVTSGELFVMNPGETHDCVCVENSYTIICVSPDFMDSVNRQIAEKCSGVPYFCGTVFSDGPVAPGIRRFFRLVEQGSAALEWESCLTSLFSGLIIRHAQSPPVLRRIDIHRAEVRRVRELIERDHSRNISLQELADVARLSPFHFQRVFRRELGVSPHEYLIQVRIRKAREYLETGVSTAQVAVDTGFVDQSHFTRHFKRQVGVPPGKYSGQNGGVTWTDIS